MRRRLALMFVDIAGSTRLVVHHAPETVLGVVQCFRAQTPRVAHAGMRNMKRDEAFIVPVPP